MARPRLSLLPDKMRSTRTWLPHFVKNGHFSRVRAYICARTRINNVGKSRNALDER